MASPNSGKGEVRQIASSIYLTVFSFLNTFVGQLLKLEPAPQVSESQAANEAAQCTWERLLDSSSHPVPQEYVDINLVNSVYQYCWNQEWKEKLRFFSHEELDYESFDTMLKKIVVNCHGDALISRKTSCCIANLVVLLSLGRRFEKGTTQPTLGGSRRSLCISQ